MGIICYNDIYVWELYIARKFIDGHCILQQKIWKLADIFF
jgi:hypothetical protein